MHVVVAVAALAGILASAFAWRLVAGGRDVWRTMPPLFATLGVLAVWLSPSVDRQPAATTGVLSASDALLIGIVTGAAFFLATRAFVSLVGRSRTFSRHVAAAYGRAETVSFATAIVLSVFVTAVGEELFWRGLVYRLGAERTSIAIAAAGCWLLYVLANLPSRLLPIIAAAIVGGALWATLAWWTGGILAPIASHMLWTGLMLGFPPGPPRAEVT
jgi:CAAX protease family protein